MWLVCSLGKMQPYTAQVQVFLKLAQQLKQFCICHVNQHKSKALVTNKLYIIYTLRQPIHILHKPHSYKWSSYQFMVSVSRGLHVSFFYACKLL